MAETNTTEAVEYLTAFAALVERPPRDDLQVDADVGDKVAAHLRALLSERTALLAKLETARKDRDAAEAAVEAAKAEVSEAVSRWCIRMADVREASGIGHKPMLDEVPGAIKARISEIEARAQAAETKLATLTEALEEIEDWSHAYPIAAFPEPDFTKARAALEAAGMTLDAVSASNMRHVVNRVAAMARKALAALAQTQEEKTNG